MHIISEPFDHFLIKKTHTGGHISDIFSFCSKENSRCDQLAADHSGINRFPLSLKPGSYDNICPGLLHTGLQILDIHWIMLTITIQLQYVVISIVISIAHTTLNSSGQPHINRQIQQIISSSGTDFSGIICGTVIDNHVIILRVVFDEIIHYPFDIFRLIISRNNNQYLQTYFSSCYFS